MSKAWRKRLKYAVIVVLALVVWAYFGLQWLQSTYIKETLLPQVIASLKTDYDLDLRMGDIKVQLLSGLVVEDLSIESDEPSLSFKLETKRLLMSYDFWSVFSSQFHLDQIHFENLELVAQLGEAQPSATEKETSVQSYFQLLDESLSSLPMAISVDAVRLSDSKVQLSDSVGNKLELPSFQFSTPLSVSQTELEIEPKMETGQTLASIDWTGLKAQVDMMFRFQLKIEKDSEQSSGWQIDLQQISTDFEITDLKIEDLLGETDLNLKLQSQNRPFRIELESSIQAPRELRDPYSLQSLSIDAEVEMSRSLSALLMTLLNDQSQLPLEGQTKVLISAETDPSVLKLTNNNEFRSEFKFFKEKDSIASKWTHKLQIPLLEYDSFQLEDLNWSANMTASGYPENLELRYEDQIQIKTLRTGYEEQVNLNFFQKGFESRTSFRLFGDQLEIQDFRVSNHDQSLLAHTSGRLNLDLSMLSLRGETKVRHKRAYFEFPWSAIRSGEDRFAFEAEAITRDFNLSMKELELKALESRIPIAVDFFWSTDKGFRFASPSSLNPFERVNFSGVQAYISDRQNNLKLEKLRWQDYVAGPVHAQVAFRQNHLLVDQYQANLLGGVAAGQIFMDLKQGQRRLGFLGRVTGLDLKQIQKPKETSDKRLSSRVALVYQFDQSVVDGRVDINEIGGPQLIDLLNVLDPNYENSNLVLARSFLKLVHPKYVGIEFQQAIMDLQIDLGGLVSVQNLGVKAVPVRPLIDAVKQDLVLAQETTP